MTTRKFDVHVFLRYCYLPKRVDIDERLSLFPLGGLQPLGEIEAVCSYCERVLGVNRPSEEDLRAMSQSEADRSPMVVVQLQQVTADGPEEAIAASKSTVELLFDLLALHQLQRGQICAVLAASGTDVLEIRGFFVIPPVRQIHNLLFEPERAYWSRMVRASQQDGRLRLFLSLFSEAVAEPNTAFQVYKLWTLLEAMATEYNGGKKQKVRSLFAEHQLSTGIGHNGHDLIDFAYEWRNAIAHEGDLDVSELVRRNAWCRPFAETLEARVEDLRDGARFLIHRYARSVVTQSSREQ